jgi:hypothetical protein
VLDERPAVAGLAAGASQGVLERRQRTDLAGHHHVRRPGQRRQVQPREARPAPHREHAERREGDEGEVQQKDGVGEQAVGHRPTVSDRYVGRNFDS